MYENDRPDSKSSDTLAKEPKSDSLKVYRKV